MRLAVVPVKNEEDTILQTLANLEPLALDEIVLVLNGCTDNSLALCQTHCQHRHYSRKRKIILLYETALGVDVPRGVGACYAKEQQASAVLFVDGDLTDDISPKLDMMLQTLLRQKQDLVLTNCYPYPDYRSPMAKEIVYHREELNRTLGLFHQIGIATPSHGPHCISSKALHAIPPWAFAIPPVELAEAARLGLKMKVGASLCGNTWHQKVRENSHNEEIAQTIIGDCLMAQQYFTMKREEQLLFWKRFAQGQEKSLNSLREGWIGAHECRKFSAIGLNAKQVPVDF